MLKNRFVFNHQLAGTDRFFLASDRATKENPFTMQLPIWERIINDDWPEGPYHKLFPPLHVRGVPLHKKEVMEKPDWGPPKPNLPQLMPPKRFLMGGSRIHTSPDTIYEFEHRGSKPPNEDAMDVWCHKLRIYKDKLQLVRIMFFFKPEQNMMVESKSAFSMITYSIEKKALYTIRSIKPNTRWVKQVRRVSLNKFTIRGLEHQDANQVDRWIAALEAAVRKDVPDVHIDCIHPKEKIISLIIQHRVGFGIKGLDDRLISNLGYITSGTYTHKVALREHLPSYKMIDDVGYPDEELHWHTTRRVTRNTVYKFLPTLAKTGSLTKAFKVLFGKHFNRTLMKLMYNFSIEYVSNGEKEQFIHFYNSLVPKSVKHTLTQLFKGNMLDEAQELAHQMASVIRAQEERDTPAHIIANWAKAQSRIQVAGPEDILNWNNWVDLYRMADRLNVAVRPSRFRSGADVRAFHDECAELLRALDPIALGIPEEFINFLPVSIPDQFEGCGIAQLLTQADLDAEHDIQGHCVHTYSDNCMKGDAIIITVTEPNGNRWTVQYNGRDFRHIQSEGPGHSRPTPEFIQSVLVPLGSEIAAREKGKPLHYKLRSGLIAQALSIIHNSFFKLEEAKTSEELVAEHLEVLNCKLERITLINRLIAQRVPPSNKKLLELVAMVDSEEADKFVQWRDPIGPPQPAQMVPAGDLLPPAIPDMRDCIPRADDNDDGIPF